MPRTTRKKTATPDSPDRNDLERTADQFFEWMEFTNYSEATIRNRRNYLGYFFQWCDDRGLHEPQEISRPIIERYQRYLYNYKKKRDGQPLSVRAQHSRLVAVRAYFKWLARRNMILYNPAADIDMPKIGHRLPKSVFNISEVESVLGMPDITTSLGLRDRAILEVFYSTGMRRMELMRLGIYDIDHERGTLIIRQGKGRKDRVVPIGERALKWVDKYTYDIRPLFVVEPDHGVLFLTDKGEPFTPNRLTQMVRDYINMAETGKKGSCHLFRHTMATLMLENGADTRFIQQMLGHAKLETTQIYTQISIRKLKDVHTATHPAKLEKGKAGKVWEEIIRDRDLNTEWDG